MQLLLHLFTALLLDILANDFFIAVTAYCAHERAFGPKFATPQALFDRRHTMKDLAGCQTFAHLDNFGRARARHRLDEKMDMIFVSANLSKDHLIPFGNV